MMENLLVEDGGLIEIENVSLPKGIYVKLQPHTIKFTQLSNPRAVLEKTLRGFSCLTKGDTIKIIVDGFNYYLDIIETRPANAISIFETDVQVEFDPPKDMKDEEVKHAVYDPPPQAQEVAFAFDDGKTGAAGTSATSSSSSSSANALPSVPPALNASLSTATGSDYFAKLAGPGYSLKSKRLAPQPSTLRAASVPTDAANVATPKRAQQVVRHGNFDYIYELDEKTNKQRLVRRMAVPASLSATSAPSSSAPFATSSSSSSSSSSSQSKVSSTGFKPFAGTGHRLV